MGEKPTLVLVVSMVTTCYNSILASLTLLAAGFAVCWLLWFYWLAAGFFASCRCWLVGLSCLDVTCRAGPVSGVFDVGSRRLCHTAITADVAELQRQIALTQAFGSSCHLGSSSEEREIVVWPENCFPYLINR